MPGLAGVRVWGRIRKEGWVGLDGLFSSVLGCLVVAILYIVSVSQRVSHIHTLLGIHPSIHNELRCEKSPLMQG